jgi:hypothetical protein
VKNIEQAAQRNRRRFGGVMLAGVIAVGLAAGCDKQNTPVDPNATGSTAPSAVETTTAPQAPTIVSFQQVGPACDSNNEITLTWTLGGSATGATISIDGPGVYNSYTGTTATEKFPGACGDGNTQTFLLTTVGGDPAATQTIVVQPAAPPAPTTPTIVKFEQIGPKCDSNNQVTLHWVLSGGATGATISIDGPGVYNEYPGTDVTEKFPGACGDQQVFLLKTVGGGASAQKTLTINP